MGGGRSSERSTIGGGAGGRLWARSELVRRWRALLALGILAGLTCGLAAAAVAGARRSEDSWDRLRAKTDASDAIIFASQAGLHRPDWAPVAALPYVDGVGAFSFVAADGVDMLVNQYGDWLTKVDRPRIIEGRAPRPDAPLEIVVERRSVATDPTAPHLRVGSRIPAHLYTGEQIDAQRFDAPEGPKVSFRVVGVAESPFSMSAIPSTAGSLFAGPAFRTAYPGSIVSFSNLLVRLHDPKHDIRRLEADVARLFPGEGVPVYDLGAASKRVTNGTGLESTGLLLFALAVAAAGMVIVGQALTRSVRAASGDLPTLAAIGLDRGDLTGALALPHLVSAAAAMVTAIGVAIGLSPRFPIGLGRRVDPDVGLHVDLPVVVGGAVLVGVLLAAAVLATAWRASGRTASALDARSSAFVRLVRRLGLPVPLVTGAALALEPGRGRRSLPTRSALSGATVGVLGLVGALVFLHGLDDAAGHPERFGTVWDVEASFNGDEPGPVWEHLPANLAADRDVTGVAEVGRLQAPVGDLVVPFYVVKQRSGRPLQFSTLSGRAPRRPGELALGPDTAHVLGVGLGDRVTIGDGHRFRVVGLSLLPTTPHSSFDQGVWVLPEDLTRAFPMSVRRSVGDARGVDLADDATFEQAIFVFGFVAADLRDGVDPKAIYPRVAKEVGDTGGPDSEITLAEPTPSADQASMRNVRSLPLLFGVFAPLVALAALLHVSSSVLRRRGTELAVLRVFGLTPRQAAACLVWQSTLLAGIGIVIGAPLGFVVGRTTWRIVAEHTPMLTVIPTLTLSVVLLLPAILVAANMAGARPAWKASRSSPVDALRVD